MCQVCLIPYSLCFYTPSSYTNSNYRWSETDLTWECPDDDGGSTPEAPLLELFVLQSHCYWMWVNKQTRWFPTRWSTHSQSTQIFAELWLIISLSLICSVSPGFDKHQGFCCFFAMKIYNIDLKSVYYYCYTSHGHGSQVHSYCGWEPCSWIILCFTLDVIRVACS